MESTELAVECIDLRRVFRLGGMLRRKGEVQALRGVSLETPRGQVFGLLGPNGAGKTTTVRILATLLHPSAGEARVLGYDVVRQSREVRKRIGLALGGDRGLFGRITAHENLRYFAAINHLPPAEAARRSDELLELVGLRGRADERVMGFSRGMKMTSTSLAPCSRTRRSSSSTSPPRDSTPSAPATSGSSSSDSRRRGTRCS